MSNEPDGFQARSIGKTIGLMIITLGLYGIYWTHQLHKELRAELGADWNPTVRTVGLFIPLYNFYVMWQTSGDLERVIDKGQGLLFVLMLLLVPVWWYVVQTEINARAA